jgi:cytochrome c oxidase subunit 4
MTHAPTSAKTYWLVFAGLILLTGLTILTAGLPIGNWHTPLALGIATIKAALVALFFMHVIHSSRITWAVILISLVMLMILLVLTGVDYWSRWLLDTV